MTTPERKRAIQSLKTALEKLSYVDPGIVYTICEKPFYDAKDFIRLALTELEKSPRWYTPEQWKERTGKPWPEDWAVYTRAKYVEGGWSRWGTLPYSESKLTMYKTQTVCATEAGIPPENWRPEGEENKEAK